MDLFDTICLLEDKKLEAAGMTAARLDMDGLETRFDMSRESMILSIEAELSRTLADASEGDLRHALQRSAEEGDDGARATFAAELQRRSDRP